jgi:hypothetical protein
MRRGQTLEEGLAVAHAFDIADHHIHVIALRQMADGLAEADIGLVAGGDPDAKIQPHLLRRFDDLAGIAAALAHQAKAAGGAFHIVEHAGKRQEGFGVQIVHAETIRAQQAHAGAARDVQDALLPHSAFGAHFRETGAENHRAADALAGAGFDCGKHGVGGQGQDGTVRAAGDIIDRLIGSQTLNFVAARVDGEDIAGKSGFLQVA